MLIHVADPVVAESVRRRPRIRHAPKIAATAYVGSWVIGLTAFPSAPAIDAPVGDVADYYAGHAAASVLQAGLVHGVAALALWVVVSSMRSNRVPRAAVLAGLAAVALSLAQFVLEVVRGLGAASIEPTTVDQLFDAVNRIDGLKMFALAAVIGASVEPFRAAGVTGKRMAVLGQAAAISLIASGAGYLMLNGTIGVAAFLSLPLLLVWVGHTGWALDRGER